MESFLKKRFKKPVFYKTTAEKETVGLGFDFAKNLTAGDVIALAGDLGTGKTHFVKGAAGFFGINPKLIVSPTFSLVKSHKGNNIQLYHFDFYRLKGIVELEKTGYRECITGENSITFVEWPEIINETWNDFTHAVRIEHAGGTRRAFTFYGLKTLNKCKRKPKK